MKRIIIALILVWAAVILLLAAGPVVAEEVEYQEKGAYHE